MPDQEVNRMHAAFKGRWICTEEFASSQPRDMYHKEHELARYALQETDPQNSWQTLCSSLWKR